MGVHVGFKICSTEHEILGKYIMKMRDGGQNKNTVQLLSFIINFVNINLLQ